jgi:hypothetical protein
LLAEEFEVERVVLVAREAEQVALLDLLASSELALLDLPGSNPLALLSLLASNQLALLNPPASNLLALLGLLASNHGLAQLLAQYPPVRLRPFL